MAHATSASARIDEILATLPGDQRTALQSLRETIAVAAPEAVEERMAETDAAAKKR